MLICSLVLILFEGPSIRRAGEQMNPSPGRTLVLAVGKPAGWLGDQLPLASVAHDATAWLSPDDKLDAADSFAQRRGRRNTGVPAGHAGRVRPGRPRASRRRARSRCGRCW